MDPVFPVIMDRVTRPDRDYNLAGSFRVFAWRFPIGRPTGESFQTLSDQNLLVLVGSGASMVRVDELGQSITSLGPSAILFRGEMAVRAVLGRGLRERVAIGWRPPCAAAVESWLDSAAGPGKGVWCRSMLCAPREAQEKHRWLMSHLASKPPHRLPQIMAAMLEVLSGVLDGPVGVPDQPCTSHVSEPIRMLMKSVSEHPGSDWSLASAAKLTRFSLYHLSRRFPLETGMRFPDFVEWCRVDRAFALLLAPGAEERLELVSEQAGFHSVAAMRTSCRRVLGLTPHEVVQKSRWLQP